MVDGMKCIECIIDYTDEKRENALHYFNPENLTHLRGCIWELLEGKEDQWLWKIDSRVKITQGDIIYIFTEEQIEEINKILREMEPSDSEDFQNNLIIYKKRE